MMNNITISIERTYNNSFSLFINR